MPEQFKKTEGGKYNKNDNYADQVLKKNTGHEAQMNLENNTKARDQI